MGEHAFTWQIRLQASPAFARDWFFALAQEDQAGWELLFGAPRVDGSRRVVARSARSVTVEVTGGGRVSLTTLTLDGTTALIAKGGDAGLSFEVRWFLRPEGPHARLEATGQFSTRGLGAFTFPLRRGRAVAGMENAVAALADDLAADYRRSLK